MAVWGKRESYSMVAFTVTVWIALATLAYIFRPLIPLDENEQLAQDRAGFMRQARFQQIQWRDMSEAVFTESRQLDRPILLVMGTGFSPLGEKMDLLLASEDVAPVVRQDYVAVRVDLERRPSWRTRVLPLARHFRGDSPFYQMVMMDYNGRLLAVPSHEELWGMGEVGMLRALQSGKVRYADREFTEIDNVQSEEATVLMGGAGGRTVDLSGYLDRLVGAIQTGSGGAVFYDRPYLTPQDFLLLYEAGRRVELGELVGPVLSSPTVNLMEGGFFFSSQGRSWMNPYYFSVSTVEGDMLELLDLLSPDSSALRWLRDSIFDRMVEEVASGSMGSYRRGTVSDNRRSPQYSFTRIPLGEALTREERVWASEVLGLDVRVNPQMTPYWTDAARFSVETDQRDTILAKLADLRSGEVSVFGSDLLIQRAYVTARLLTVAGDMEPARRERARAAFGELRRTMRFGFNDVYGSSLNGAMGVAGLGAYLTYADAALQAYRLDGDLEVLADGRKVLERGLALYTEPNGTLAAGDGFMDQSVVRRRVPDVVDSEMPSLLGQAVILSTDYALLGGEAEKRDGLERARRLLGTASFLLGEGKCGLSGLGRASLRLERAASQAGFDELLR